MIHSSTSTEVFLCEKVFLNELNSFVFVNQEDISCVKVDLMRPLES